MNETKLLNSLATTTTINTTKNKKMALLNSQTATPGCSDESSSTTASIITTKSSSSTISSTQSSPSPSPTPHFESAPLDLSLKSSTRQQKASNHHQNYQEPVKRKISSKKQSINSNKDFKDDHPAQKPTFFTHSMMQNPLLMQSPFLNSNPNQDPSFSLLTALALQNLFKFPNQFPSAAVPAANNTNPLSNLADLILKNQMFSSNNEHQQQQQQNILKNIGNNAETNKQFHLPSKLNLNRTSTTVSSTSTSTISSPLMYNNNNNNNNQTAALGDLNMNLLSLFKSHQLQQQHQNSFGSNSINSSSASSTSSNSSSSSTTSSNSPTLMSFPPLIPKQEDFSYAIGSSSCTNRPGSKTNNKKQSVVESSYTSYNENDEVISMTTKSTNKRIKLDESLMFNGGHESELNVSVVAKKTSNKGRKPANLAIKVSPEELDHVVKSKLSTSGCTEEELVSY
jgi:hypothetical protein